LKAKKYRIWYGWSDEGSGDRYEICRVKANNIDDAIKFVVDEILADGVFFWENGDEENIYMVLDSCTLTVYLGTNRIKYLCSD